MDRNEKCPKYPSMLRTQCSHCQGTEWRTAKMPQFSLRQFREHGSPMIEIQKDGGPVHAYDSEFKFTPTTARMIMACMGTIRWFAQSDEKERLEFKGKLVNDRTLVTMYMEFETSNGRRVEQPYLKLESLSGNEMRRGLGTMKCQAICAVETDLRNWLQKHGGIMEQKR